MTRFVVLFSKNPLILFFFPAVFLRSRIPLLHDCVRKRTVSPDQDTQAWSVLFVRRDRRPPFLRSLIAALCSPLFLRTETDGYPLGAFLPARLPDRAPPFPGTLSLYPLSFPQAVLQETASLKSGETPNPSFSPTGCFLSVFNCSKPWAPPPLQRVAKAFFLFEPDRLSFAGSLLFRYISAAHLMLQPAFLFVERDASLFRDRLPLPFRVAGDQKAFFFPNNRASLDVAFALASPPRLAALSTISLL